MASFSDVVLEDNPTASERLLARLKSHLPHSLAVLRRIQCAQKIPGASTPDTHILYAHQRGTTEYVDGSGEINESEGHFAAAYVDLSRAPETEVWIYSSLEDLAVSTASVYGITLSNSGSVSGEKDGVTQPTATTLTNTTTLVTTTTSNYTPEEETTALNQVTTILRRIRTISLALGRRGTGTDESTANSTDNPGPSNDENDEAVILIGALHEHIRRGLLFRGVRVHKAPFLPPDLEWEFCGKWLFRVEDLPVGLELAGEGMRFDRLREGDVEAVLERTVIKRRGTTLLMLPSTVVRLEDGTPIAWAFLALDGTIMTLHVEEPYRRLGLAKALGCRLLRDHLHEFGDDGWGAADVYTGNLASQAFCRSIGGKLSWIHSWTRVLISSVGEPI